jgi:hypothetical protein
MNRLLLTGLFSILIFSIGVQSAGTAGADKMLFLTGERQM